MNTIIKASEDFIFHCRFEKGLSSKTIQSYSSDINQFIDFLHSNSHSIKLIEIDKFVLKIPPIIIRLETQNDKKKDCNLKGFIQFFRI